MEWIIGHWSEVVEILLMVLGAASIVAKLTPTKVDDLWIGKIISIIGLVKKVPKKAKSK